jgi:uncharacterized heparinase superfamily protein
LAAFQGGAPCPPAYVAAARAQDETGDRAAASDCGGYQRMDAPAVQVLADVGPPASGAWSARAREQPLAVQVLVGGRRLIDPGTGRGIATAATAEVGEGGHGRVLTGFPARMLGPRLVDAEVLVDARRHAAPGALWLDLAHRGWIRRYGLMHQRRLYLDVDADELRGEDRLTPTAKAQGPDGRHFVSYAIRFPLHPGVQALVSQDRRSVLLRPAGAAEGWVLRNDSLEIALEPLPGGQRPGQQLVLRGQRRADSGARVRWKLAAARQQIDGRRPGA